MVSLIQYNDDVTSLFTWLLHIHVDNHTMKTSLSLSTLYTYIHTYTIVLPPLNLHYNTSSNGSTEPSLTCYKCTNSHLESYPEQKICFITTNLQQDTNMTTYLRTSPTTYYREGHGKIPSIIVTLTKPGIHSTQTQTWLLSP